MQRVFNHELSIKTNYKSNTISIESQETANVGDIIKLHGIHYKVIRIYERKNAVDVSDWCNTYLTREI